jgi:hypothetical protein
MSGQNAEYGRKPKRSAAVPIPVDGSWKDVIFGDIICKMFKILRVLQKSEVETTTIPRPSCEMAFISSKRDLTSS